MDDLAFSEEFSAYVPETTYVWLGDGSSGTLAAEDATIRLGPTSLSNSVPAPYRPGDLDGDGYDDFLAAQRSASSATVSPGSGRLFLWSGHPALGDTTADDADMVIESDREREYLGWGVADPIDLDGDGFDDLVAGTPDWYELTAQIGRVYVWYGPLVFGGIELSSSADGVIEGTTDLEEQGFRLDNAGDVDGDGIDDLWIGSNQGPVLWLGGPRP